MVENGIDRVVDVRDKVLSLCEPRKSREFEVTGIPWRKSEYAH